jgi:predicted O-methyltransferase YrrM
MSIELETAELLCALVRYTKPELVVECGTGQGLSTQAIAQGLLANGSGVVHSWEPIEEFFIQATEVFGDHSNVVIHRGIASEDCDLTPDFVFVDTGGGPDVREPDIAHWLQHEANPLVVVHDANRKYESFRLGEGVLIPGWDGVWIGRGSLGAVL